MFSPRNFVLITSSAVLQAAAFLCPNYFFWASLFALVPVFFAQLKGLDRPGRAGAVWGTIFAGIFLIGLLPFLEQFAHGAFKYAAYAGVVFYFSLFSGLWFWGADYLGWCLGRIAGCFIAANLFFFVLTYLIMTPFGPTHGVPLMNPLVPLVTHPFLIKGVAYLGMQGMTMLLICFQLSIAVIATNNVAPNGSKKSSKAKLIPISTALICVVITALGSLKMSDNTRLTTPSPNHHIAYLTPPTNKEKFPNEVCNNVASRIKELLTHHPETQLILMPEGTCCFALHCVPGGMDQIALALGNVPLILGSHRKDDRNNYFNCMYVIQGDYKEPIYDKTYCVPFAEYVPYPWNCSETLNELFLEGHWPLTPGCREAEVCSAGMFSFIPQICYDLYFRPGPPPSTHFVASRVRWASDYGLCELRSGRSEQKRAAQVPILHLTNDRWYLPYLQHLLFLLARLRAIEWGREIWYVAHTGGWRITPHGEVLAFLGYTPPNSDKTNSRTMRKNNESIFTG